MRRGNEMKPDALLVDIEMNTSYREQVNQMKRIASLTNKNNDDIA